MSTALTRPLLHYYGGKWRIADWVISHFPPHEVYVEAFGGGGGVLLQKPRSKSEVYNDLDGEVVNLFRVLRDPQRSEELLQDLELTPYAREEFNAARAKGHRSNVERARRLLIRSFAGYGTTSIWDETGFRSTPHGHATNWRDYPDALRAIISRLKGVVIERRDGCDVMRVLDGPATLHYCDPPYLHATRKRKNPYCNKGYRHEFRDDCHERLAEALHKLEGFVVLSCYPNPTYDAMYSGWPSVLRHTRDFRGNERVEQLLFSPRTADRLQGRLF